MQSTDAPGSDSPEQADVLVVGCGPVGATLALALARRGWSVVVIEQHAQPYPLPRAVGMDGETARILASVGLGDELPSLCEPASEYVWQNAAGQTLLRFDYPPIGPDGWPAMATFHQPALEDALGRRLDADPGVVVHRGLRATAVTAGQESVSVMAAGPAATARRFEARYVVGCDGANSLVREHLGVTMHEAGFCHDWLVCDVTLKTQREFRPAALQICDPKRPSTAVSSGPGRRRWEFMRVPGDSLESLAEEATAWRLLAPFGVTPESAVLHRHVVYRFLARWCESFRAGRLLVAGDAAHLMPPFAAQGMCSGIRDAWNLAWKLDLVLRGSASDPILDSYTAERLHHVQHAIAMSLELGKVICLPDVEAAAGRDAHMIGLGADPRRILPPLPPPTLGDRGLLFTDETGAAVPPAGRLTPQARVARGAAVGRFDDVVGRGFVLACAEDPAQVLHGAWRGFLDALGVRILHLVPPGLPVSSSVETVVDLDNVYLPHLRADGLAAVLVRPDFYLFGGVQSLADLPALVSDLRARLG